MRLKDCFKQDFTEWLCESNHPEIVDLTIVKSNHNNILPLPVLFGDRFKNIEEKALSDILSILIDEPNADYFWYTHREHGSRLTYALPHHDVVPGDSLILDKDKIKSFLRDMKIDSLLS